ncbi:MAG: MATE family efflux transporter, partial [Mediterranea sp.]|nr:MATE family efflux transporter [Mediterranea sp.]
ALFVPEQAAYEAGGVFLRIDSYSQILMMVEITMQGIFYGIGRTVPPAVVSITFNYLRIPLAILFVRMGMGVEGIWWAVSTTSIAKGVVLLCWFVLTKRKSLQIQST